MTSMRLAPAIVLVVACGLAAGCSSPEDEAQSPAPEPVLTSNPVMTQAPDGSAMTPGEWTIGEDAAGAHARFGPPNSEPILAMECDTATQSLRLVRAGTASDITGGSAGMNTYVLDAGGTKAQVDMVPMAGGLPLMGAEINRTMPIFQAFAQAGTLITVTAPDGAMLRLPGAPGITRVIDACSRV